MENNNIENNNMESNIKPEPNNSTNSNDSGMLTNILAYNKDNYKCSLYKVSFDGSEHEKIFDLGTAPDMSNIYYSYVVTDSCVFYSAAIGVSGEKNAAKLNRYIFDNSKIETVYNYEGDKAEIFDLKMCKDKVFFRQSVGNERLKSENIDLKKDAQIQRSFKEYWLEEYRRTKNLSRDKLMNKISEFTGVTKLEIEANTEVKFEFDKPRVFLIIE